jgi:hypothetical protein
MTRARTTIGLLLAGLLGLIASSSGHFGSPWPWLVVLGFGAFRAPALGILRANTKREEQALLDLTHARHGYHVAGADLTRLKAQWETRIDGTLTPDESRELRAAFNAIVLRMAELEEQVSEVAKEQRTRALAAPFTENG